MPEDTNEAVDQPALATVEQHDALAKVVDETKEELDSVNEKLEEVSRAVLPPPVGELDASLIVDVSTQLVDLVSSLDGELQKNVAESDELKAAKSDIQSARVRLELALRAAGGDTPWQNERKG